MAWPRRANIGAFVRTGVHDGYRSLLWYLLAGTRGGPNRVRLLQALHERPHNAHQLAELLKMDYRTVRHHLRLLEQNRLVERPVGVAYASPYELSPDLLARFHLVEEIRDGTARPGRLRAPFHAGRPTT
jgi:DNA-binding transcriptional ArsR family regulator